MRRIRIHHATHYAYAQPVQLLKHRLLIRPREGHDIRIESSKLSIAPEYSIRWYRDVYGNSVASVQFQAAAQELSVVSEVVVQHFGDATGVIVVAPDAMNFPFRYDPMEQVDLLMYLLAAYPQDSAKIGEWLRDLLPPTGNIATIALLDAVSLRVSQDIAYEVREEAGVQSPAVTLQRRKGSCRDMATLFIESCRYLGLAARFVSGYLLSSAAVQDVASTHAWSEVYLPAGGWQGFDSTSGLHVSGEHVAVAVHRHPEAIPPIAGAFIGPEESTPTMHVSVRAELL